MRATSVATATFQVNETVVFMQVLAAAGSRLGKHLGKVFNKESMHVFLETSSRFWIRIVRRYNTGLPLAWFLWGTLDAEDLRTDAPSGSSLDDFWGEGLLHGFYLLEKQTWWPSVTADYSLPGYLKRRWILGSPPVNCSANVYFMLNHAAEHSLITSLP